MRILELLKSRKKSFYILLIVLGLGNTLIYSAILFFINNAITAKPNDSVPDYHWLWYLLVIAVSAICNIVSQRSLIVMTNETLVSYETSILQKVKFATYEMFEKMGKQQIYSALGDSWVLAEFPRTFVASANTLIIVICSIAYMFFINVYVASVFLIFLIGLSYAYIRSGNTVKREFSKIQAFQDSFYNYMNDFLDGYKEMKMRSLRSDNVLNKFIRENREAKKQISIKTFLNDTLFGFASRFTWYLLIGAIIFLFPVVFKFPVKEMTICLLIVLHMLESMNFFLGSIPFYYRVETTLQKMDELDITVKHFESAKLLEKEYLPENDFEKIEFSHVEYSYPNSKNRNNFALGPINLTINKGEVLFIEGGNGSGKSTFVNLLTGLYVPKQGNIYFNEDLVTAENYESYMNKFSAVFTSNFLFSENYDDFLINDENKDLEKYLKLVRLKDIIKINSTTNWIDSKLSKGQQKRLALVYSLMEEREIMILDEWAAEQDPDFRHYFYTEIIPQLKKMGKTMILVTHDDRFISQADRVIKFEEGCIAHDLYSKLVL